MHLTKAKPYIVYVAIEYELNTCKRFRLGHRRVLHVTQETTMPCCVLIQLTCANMLRFGSTGHL